jgi:hypothetical protein
MKSRSTMFNVCALTGALFGAMLSIQAQQDSAHTAQRGFATPQAAADALLDAADRYDVAAVVNILGPHSEELVSSKDPVQDRNRAREFTAKAREKQSVEIDPADPKRATLVVGNEQWPFPLPIVDRNGKWYFDAKAGREEILMRRIGQNELDAITVCRGYVDAQKDYAEGSEGHQYAQRIISTPGKKDGLYWQDADGTAGGPLADAVAKAIQEGYSTSQPATPYHGYYFTILKGQGPAAKLGQLDFVTHGVMIGGFALVAAPAEYRVTGVKTFLVSHDGVVYQKDLGPNTLKIFRAMDRFNPDKTWTPTNDEW